MRLKYSFSLNVIAFIITLPFRIIGLIGLYTYAILCCIFRNAKFSKCCEAINEGLRQGADEWERLYKTGKLN